MNEMNNYKEIIKNTNYFDVDIFFKDYEDFEEIPIIDRYKQIERFRKYIKNDDISGFLLEVTIEVVRNVLICARKRFSESQFSNYFLAITITDTENGIKENGFFIPMIMISQKNNLFHFLDNKDKIDLANISILQKYGTLLQTFEFYRERWEEQNVERIFILPKDINYSPHPSM
jgi:hypothetical protein